MHDFQIKLRYTHTTENFDDGDFEFTKKTPCKKGEVDLGPIHVRILRLRQNHSAHSWHRELAIHRQKTCRMCWPSYRSITWSSALLMSRRQKGCNCEIHALVINVIKQESTSLKAAIHFLKTLFFSCALGRLSKKNGFLFWQTKTGDNEFSSEAT